MFLNSNPETDGCDLYTAIGLPRYSTTAAVRQWLDESGQSQNISEVATDSIELAATILANPMSKQRYDVLLSAQTSKDKLIPYITDSSEEQALVELALKVGISLERLEDGLYRTCMFTQSPRTSHSPHEIAAIPFKDFEIGICKFQIQLKPFFVSEQLFHKPIRVAYLDGSSFDAQALTPRLPLSHADAGAMLVVNSRRANCLEDFAGSVNFTQNAAIYFPQSLNRCFRQPLGNIAETFGVRAKKNRIIVLIEQFQDAIADFANENSLNYTCFRKEQLRAMADGFL